MITIIIAQYIIKNLTHRGHWYLLRAKFTYDLNFWFMRLGEGGMQKRCLEIAYRPTGHCSLTISRQAVA